VFLMAPIHHHFEKLGWAEPKIVDRFFVVSILFVIAGALTMTWR
jgi:phospho-N-acetylmuramoyl-pentapeptide-transferase